MCNNYPYLKCFHHSKAKPLITARPSHSSAVWQRPNGTYSLFCGWLLQHYVFKVRFYCSIFASFCILKIFHYTCVYTPVCQSVHLWLLWLVLLWAPVHMHLFNSLFSPGNELLCSVTVLCLAVLITAKVFIVAKPYHHWQYTGLFQFFHSLANIALFWGSIVAVLVIYVCVCLYIQFEITIFNIFVYI